MVWIKTIDFPDGQDAGTIASMDNNLYALQILVEERLDRARAEARRLDLLARARTPRRPVRVRAGAALIGLGEWLRGAPALAAIGRP
jgi:hypothetical protein